MPLSEIAVLFRSSFHSFDLELELSRADLPFVKRGGFKFIETAHVKDALAHLRVLENPRDAVSWHRVLHAARGRRPEDRRRDRLAPDRRSTTSPPRSNPPAAAPTPPSCAPSPASSAASASRAAGPTSSSAEVLRYYEPLLKRVHPDDYPKRQRDLEHFVSIAARYRSLRVAAHRHGARAAQRQRRRRARRRRRRGPALPLDHPLRQGPRVAHACSSSGWWTASSPPPTACTPTTSSKRSAACCTSPSPAPSAIST